MKTFKQLTKLEKERAIIYALQQIGTATESMLLTLNKPINNKEKMKWAKEAAKTALYAEGEEFVVYGVTSGSY